jgi:cyclopropane fatty-acyl-phospholipid synthase-like methyltransferase
MNEDEEVELIFSAMRWNTPLSEERAKRLLAGLELGRAETVLDLGCGWGELLLRAVAAGLASGSDCRGIGVDDDEPLLARGRDAARARGLEQRVSFVIEDASTWEGSAQAVLCIGASHAWGGTTDALRALRRAVVPGGRLLYGDGFWAAQPGKAAIEIFGDEVLTPEGLQRAVGAAGWETVETSTVSMEEWDAFEASYRAGRERWAAEHPDDPLARTLAAEMQGRREEYESVYRGILGFTYLILRAPVSM